MIEKRAPLDEQIVLDTWALCFGETAQSALSDLCARAKDQRVVALLNAQPEREQLRTLLSAPAPKVRKNAARLIGALATKADAPTLLACLNQEHTYFVVPSLLLALGNTQLPSAADFIKNYLANLPDMDPKHRRDIDDAANAVLCKLLPTQSAEFIGLDKPRTILLRAPANCADVLFQEAKENGIAATFSPEGITLKTKEYASLFCLRCFDEALFPICTLPAPAEDIDAWTKTICERSHFEEFAAFYKTPPAYRIELRGVEHERRIKLIEHLRRGIALQNSPSSYDIELRVEIEDGKTAVFVKLYRPADARFDYRINSVSASISPVTAACIIRMAKRHTKPNARVVDPCCGSGTLLIERARFGAQELFGVDLDANAIRLGRENVKASRLPVTVIGGDALTFRPHAPFDELYANLPFGMRVGGVDANRELYEGLFDRFGTLVNKGGIIVLYTTQRSLLKRLLYKHKLTVIDERRLEAGGLLPYMMILQQENS